MAVKKDKIDTLDKIEQHWTIWTKLDRRKIDKIGQNWIIWTKLDKNKIDKIGQYGQNCTIWTKLDIMDKIVQTDR